MRQERHQSTSREAQAQAQAQAMEAMETDEDRTDGEESEDQALAWAECWIQTNIVISKTVSQLAKDVRGVEEVIARMIGYQTGGPIERCWQEQVHDTMQYKLCFKLRNLMKVPKTLNNDKLISYYTSTLKAEEDLQRQKSRIQWLKDGDCNSSYFFNAINGKRNRSKIHSITGDDSSLIEGDILVKNEAIRQFQTILGCSMPARHGIGSTLSNIIDKVIFNDQAAFMGRDITNDEIREVCFSFHPNKAPGPDGFNAHFFKITWDIVGEDVISVVQEFFRSGLLLKELNAMILTLVPKVLNPSKMKDFRPISCCNTLYNIIAKIIANRIKPCLQDIISPSQSAFVAGRSIGDNILLAQELM
ncbi:hypothetical protein Dsin_032163 [Dipteronia sinensis]|uniref:Reverse transcriptase domain-containing protein n=1 Tax=Dipteronia sinensis TaxID=43782 RepID=A0AAE0DT29_9ROSI|nr:hypothetical protein Dsin_032163 [Dipteronia sinensis]